MERFTGRARAYAAARPSYPDGALDALFDGLGAPASLVVADVGAGTGISSRLLAARGACVIAVEPNAAMRAQATSDPRVTTRDGTAEATGLDDASVDLVTAFQAWHWFDHDRAVAEARRIVRRGGRIAVVYNERDESDAFTAAFGGAVRAAARDDTEARRGRALERFANAPGAWRKSFRNAQTLDAAGLRERVDSISYVPHDGPDADALHAEVDAIFARFAQDGIVRMALETTVAAFGV